MTARAALERLLAAARDWHAALPHIPLMLANPGATTPASAPICATLLAAAPHVEWRHTYSETEVGRDFLNAFGWFELAGPDGHFITRQTRMTVGFWGPGLHYDWHQHPAEEIYSVVAGAGRFALDGAPDQMLGAGETRFHPGETRHALTTTDQPVLTFVLWRGDGLADDPRMST